MRTGAFNNRDFREGLVNGKAYKVKEPIGREDSSAKYIIAKLIAIYPTYALFDNGKYLFTYLHYDLANGAMKRGREHGRKEIDT